jgi:hypothetical protein
VERGTDCDLDAWAETDLTGLFLLRDFLTSDTKPQSAESEFESWSKGSHPRDAIDNISAAVATIAARHPGEFLEVFADFRAMQRGSFPSSDPALWLWKPTCACRTDHNAADYVRGI